MTRAPDYDPEEPEDFDRDDDPDGTDTEPCPFCKREVHDRTDICPHCGNFINWDQEPARKSTWLYIVVAALVIVGLLTMLF